MECRWYIPRLFAAYYLWCSSCLAALRQYDGGQKVCKCPDVSSTCHLHLVKTETTSKSEPGRASQNLQKIHPPKTTRPCSGVPGSRPKHRLYPGRPCTWPWMPCMAWNKPCWHKRRCERLEILWEGCKARRKRSEASEWYKLQKNNSKTKPQRQNIPPSISLGDRSVSQSTELSEKGATKTLLFFAPFWEVLYLIFPTFGPKKKSKIGKDYNFPVWLIDMPLLLGFSFHQTSKGMSTKDPYEAEENTCCALMKHIICSIVILQEKKISCFKTQQKKKKNFKNL